MCMYRCSHVIKNTFIFFKHTKIIPKNQAWTINKQNLNNTKEQLSYRIGSLMIMLQISNQQKIGGK